MLLKQNFCILYYNKTNNMENVRKIEHLPTNALPHVKWNVFSNEELVYMKTSKDWNRPIPMTMIQEMKKRGLETRTYTGTFHS